VKACRDKNIPQKGKLVSSLMIEFPVKSIESPRGPVMDGKTYDALKSEEFPNITFLMKENVITSITDKSVNKFKLLVTGDLTIAGFIKTITLTLNGQRLDNYSFRFEGSYSLKMTEYNVVPPTAMFGQIVTGDEVTMAFNLLLDEMK
jgi:polyisoprenoid-binding protein YceI